MDDMSGVKLVASLASGLFLNGLLLACANQPHVSEESARLPAGSGRPTSFNGIDVAPPGTPCRMAVHGAPITIAAASEAPVYLPSNGADDVTEAWRCSDTPVFMFGDVQLSFESGWENVPPQQEVEDLADDHGGSVQNIHGLSAWVVSSPNDEVLMIKDGTAIRLLAPGDVPIQDLVDLAESLDLTRSVS